MTPRDCRALLARERRASQRRAERRGERMNARQLAIAKAVLDAAQARYGYRGGKKKQTLAVAK